jgi:triosephosphate isomerase
MAMVESMTNILNSARISKDTEVVICPPAVYTSAVKSKLRGDVAIGVQDVWYDLVAVMIIFRIN